MPAKKKKKKIQKKSISYKKWLIAGVLCGLLILLFLPSVFKSSKLIAPSSQQETEINNAMPDSYPQFFKNIFTQVHGEKSNFTQALSFENNDVWWMSNEHWNLLVRRRYSLKAHVRTITNAPNQEVMARHKTKI